MLDNNLSPIRPRQRTGGRFLFQSFLCWIIIYHPNLDRRVTSHYNAFQSFLCWIIIYHRNTSIRHCSPASQVSILLMLDNNLSPPEELEKKIDEYLFQSFLCWIIIYHHISCHCPCRLVKSFNPSYAG